MKVCHSLDNFETHLVTKLAMCLYFPIYHNVEGSTSEGYNVDKADKINSCL